MQFLRNAVLQRLQEDPMEMMSEKRSIGVLHTRRISVLSKGKHNGGPVIIISPSQESIIITYSRIDTEDLTSSRFVLDPATTSDLKKTGSPSGRQIPQDSTEACNRY